MQDIVAFLCLSCKRERGVRGDSAAESLALPLPRKLSLDNEATPRRGDGSLAGG